MIRISSVKDALLTARQEAGILTRDLAEMSGVHECTIIALQKGRVRNPEWYTIKILLETCGFDIAIVPSGKAPPPPLVKNRRGRPRKQPLPER